MRRLVKCDFVDIQILKRAFALSFCGGKIGQLEKVVLQLCIADI
jgi:hypothetical protein